MKQKNYLVDRNWWKLKKKNPNMEYDQLPQPGNSYKEIEK